MKVLRAITKKQMDDLQNGRPIIAKEPGNNNVTMQNHIMHGSRIKSKFISCTSKMHIYFKPGNEIWTYRDFGALVAIDMDAVNNSGSGVITDLSTRQNLEKAGITHWRSQNYALGSYEFLGEGEIMPNFVTVLATAEEIQNLYASMSFWTKWDANKTMRKYGVNPKTKVRGESANQAMKLFDKMNNVLDMAEVFRIYWALVQYIKSANVNKNIWYRFYQDKFSIDKSSSEHVA